MERRWQLSHARGYLMLGMFDEALAEIENLSIEDKEASAVRVEVLHAAQKWTRLRKFATKLVDHEPGEVGWWVSLAFATRRCVSVDAAHKLLLKAEEIHGEEAIIQFNLGCYACQIGALEEARERVRRSIAADRHFLEIAKNDTDLAPLRESDPEFPSGN